MTKTYDYDLFVIGAGSGGVRAARVAAAHGARVAIAEEFRVGGTCVIRGCVPKKLLVYGAHFAEDLQDARRFGWKVGRLQRSTGRRLRDNVLGEVERLEGIYHRYPRPPRGRDDRPARDRHRPEPGHARRRHQGQRRDDPDRDGRAPGDPRRARAPSTASPRTRSSISRAMPKRVVIAGGGYIANEFAGIFHQFSCHVTIVNRGDRILRHYDEQIRDRLLTISLMKGIDFKFNAPFKKIEKGKDGTLLLQLEGQDPIEADMLLWAVGRAPNTAGLGLDKAGVKLGKNGAILVDEDNQSSVPSIYAIGDVTDRVQLTPVAIREGHAFAETPVRRQADPGRLCQYPFGGVQPPADRRRRHDRKRRRATRSAPTRPMSSDFRPMKNVLAGRNERSLYKLIVDQETEKVLGIHMIGPDAPEILQAAAIAVKAGLTKAQFDETIALHPTMSEELVLMR